MNNYKAKAAEFLNIADDFRLGSLPTEQQHPLTGELSDLAKNNLREACELIRKIDVSVMDSLQNRLDDIYSMALAVQDTLLSGGNVFLSGCGATGRLALTLEWIWKQEAGRLNTNPQQLTAFMSGGDLAVVKAIEAFEDHPEYGERQLLELGFGSNDLLIAITEGGETPFVIGTAEAAAAASDRKPFFVYCNPTEELCSLVERSRRVIENPQIIPVCLTSGPQVLSGSTRMQATTIQQLAVGTALFAAGTQKNQAVSKELISREISILSNYFKKLDIQPLVEFIEEESSIYKKGQYLVYETKDYPMAVATDTTERAPTFSLTPFENYDDTSPVPSWAYLSIPGTRHSLEAWETLLGHAPRTLEWPGVKEKAGINRMKGYDISRKALPRRQKLLAGKELHLFRILRSGADMEWLLGKHSWKINTSSLNLLQEFTLLKILMNTHSTLVMGRMNRYESNIMLHVRPSNNKLIDRSARYILHLLKRDGIVREYSEVVTEIFRQTEFLQEDESIVWEVYKSLKSLIPAEPGKTRERR
ncbi:MAG: hypothetical protein CSA11_00025 [Chloroflexi bacterium]|nr:MAG: hypothetical protein CSA11_00025 [Chloroflexota bacterium]